MNVYNTECDFMKAIIEMNREELLDFQPECLKRYLALSEIIHIAKTLGAF